MKRTPLPARKTPMPRGKGPKPVSNKRQAENRVRRKVVKELARHIDHCQAGERIVTLADPHHRCAGEIHDPHERLPRGRGGSITDPANIILVCRPCHDWIGTHMTLADDLELLESAWGKHD
jgi:hypothetical protein